MRQQPLPENIPFLADRSITRRWMAWLRSVHRQTGSSLDVEMLQAFSDLNRVDLAPLADQAALALLDRPIQESSAAHIEELKTLGAGTLPLPPPADSTLLEYLVALIGPYREWSEIRVVQDTAANAGLYPALAYVQGSFRRETDTQKVFIQSAGAWVQIIAPAFLAFLAAAATHGAIKRDGAGLVIRVGDDSADSFLKVLDEAYGAAWDGKTEVPTKNAVYDKIQSLLGSAAYTQTYATADRTHANPTSATLTDSTGGSGDTTVVDVGAAFNQGTLNNNFADVVAQINALRADLLDVKQLANSVIDDLQGKGILT